MENKKKEIMVNLGDEVEDSITGFRGIVTGIARYITGCVQVLIVPRKGCEPAKPGDECWIDEKRLLLIYSKLYFVPDTVRERADAGPQNTPPARHP